MKAYDVATTVGQLVAERPERARVFERLGIDYCCGGKVSLAEACRKKGLDAGTVLQVLEAAEQGGGGVDQTDWTKASLRALCEHIVQTHHDYLRRELPRLTELTTKVAAVHGSGHAELEEVRYTFAVMRAELEEHMMKEERILFPMIAQIESGDAEAGMHCGGIQNPIRVMELEHDSAGAALARMRELTRDYTVPQDACNTYRVMLEGLAALEADLHQHVHKENNILFPRAIELTQGACVEH